MSWRRSGPHPLYPQPIPALAPSLFLVLLLDAIMSRLLMSSKQGAERGRLQRAVWTDLGLAGLSLLVWYSYFAHLLSV